VFAVDSQGVAESDIGASGDAASVHAIKHELLLDSGEGDSGVKKTKPEVPVFDDRVLRVEATAFEKRSTAYYY
jgi:hypothetical protein